MKSLYRLRTIISVLCFAVFGFSPITQAQTNFEAHLSGSNEVPALTTTATSSVMATLIGNELTLEGSFGGLTGDYAASHIHFGMAGQAGGVLTALTASMNADNKSGTYATADNTFTLSDGQVDTLMMQGLYINKHTFNLLSGWRTQSSTFTGSRCTFPN
ncbi:MAG TPA: hypothetical protein DEQ34_05120 [Balneolaceae bacterium]|nr:hypothetical protein [Balneolaceae bacterium]|tara:strand:+ start:1229 stop:1705 length:477 start_codon:yes stop_codon:yes gene_type:complete